MTFASLLARHPSATIVDPGTDSVSAGLLGSTESTVATDVPVWVTDRRASEVVYGEAGAVVVDADVLTETAIDVGHRLDLTDGRTYVVVGRAKTRHDQGGRHHYAYPARRIESAG